MAKKVYSWANPRPIQLAPDFGASMTVQDQSLSVRQLRDRYVRGMPLDTSVRTPLYYDGEFPDIKNMDISEITALKREVGERIREQQSDLQKQEQEKRDQKTKALEKEIEALKEQMKQNNSPGLIPNQSL